MVIGIIGAGISGLVAGRLLAQGGHEVTVFEKNPSFGGKLSTLSLGKDNKTLVDNRVACFPASDSVFKEFVNELSEKNILKKWAEYFPFHDGEEVFDNYPGHENRDYYAAPDGINKVTKYLSRWVDIVFNESVGGFTFIGDKRHKKKAWMINLSSFNVFEFDAIIISVPAVQAFGLIETAQDETSIRALIKDVDKIEYDNCFSLSVGYKDQAIPQWKGIESRHSDISWISNESSKRQNEGELALVVQSSQEFFHNHKNDPAEKIVLKLLKSASEIAGEWMEQPEWSHLDNWMYKAARNPLDVPFVEVKNEDAPLALIGDYFGGNDIEAAYLSGYKLAEHWLAKYPAK